MASYAPAHLLAVEAPSTRADALFGLATSPEADGYVRAVVAYVADVCAENPKRGVGTGRTSLFGLQRPPLDGRKTVLRQAPGALTLDATLACAAPFVATNAASQLVVSVAASEGNDALVAALAKAGVECVVEDDAAFAARSAAAWSAITAPPAGATVDGAYPLASHLVSTLVPLGHIKSTDGGDEAFAEYFAASPKWLKLE
jgi:hypothetical protein